MLFTRTDLQYFGMVQRNFNQWYEKPSSEYDGFVDFHAIYAKRKMVRLIGVSEYDAIEAGTETDTDYSDDMKRLEMIFTAIEMVRSDKAFNDNAIIAASIQSRISTEKLTRPSMQALFMQAQEIMINNGLNYGEELSDCE